MEQSCETIQWNIIRIAVKTEHGHRAEIQENHVVVSHISKTMEERQRCGIILSHIFPRIEELVVPVGEQIAGRLSNWRKNRAAGWRCQCNHQRVHKPVQTIFISATLNVQVQPPLCTQSSAGHRCSIKIDTLARKSENPKIFSKSLRNARKHM